MLSIATSLVLTAGVVAVVLPASAGPNKTPGPVGSLVLKTGVVDEITYGVDKQSLSTTGNCDLTSTGKNLLTLRGLQGATVKKVGFRDDSIGVIESSNTNLCNKVDVVSFTSTETLELKLGTDLKFAGQQVAASSASLDVEVRSFFGSKAKIQATATMTGNPTPIGTFELTQGSAACNVLDNGNCKWDIIPTGLFDTLQLKALKGSFSLEGGADGTAPTTINLVGNVDAVLECTPGNLVGDEASGTTVTYVGSVTAGQCTKFGATLNVGDNFVQFLKPLGVDPTAQFVVDVDWKSPGTPNGAVTLDPVFIDFEVGEVNETKLAFCPPAFYGVNGEFLGKITDLSQVPGDFEPGLDGKQFACIGTRSATVSSTEVVTSDQIYLIGDANLRR